LGSILGLQRAPVAEAKIGLVNDQGGIEGAVVVTPPQLPMGDSAELPVEKRVQAINRVDLAVAGGF
jgi:hypothetical protein